MTKHPAAVTFSSNALDYDHTDRTMSGFASDMQFDGMSWLDAKATELGIWIKSHRTGNEEPFKWLKTERDNEGDIRWWTFKNEKLNIILTVWNT